MLTGTHWAFSGETRLHTYKRPCWALSLQCPGPDSNRAAGLHPENGEYMSCSAWRFVEFARCRSDLSLSMPIASLCVEFPFSVVRLYASSLIYPIMRLRCHGQRALGESAHTTDRSAHPCNWLRVSLERKRDVKKRYSVGAQERFEGCEKGDGYAFCR
jgi:hypothetical protein